MYKAIQRRSRMLALSLIGSWAATSPHSQLQHQITLQAQLTSTLCKTHHSWDSISTWDRTVWQASSLAAKKPSPHCRLSSFSSSPMRPIHVQYMTHAGQQQFIQAKARRF